MNRDYKGLDNRNLRLLTQSDQELLFQKYKRQIWVIQTSKSGEEAARRLKMTPDQIKNFSFRLRSKGIAVKLHKRTFKSLPKEKLSLLRELAAKLKTKPFDHEKFVRLWQTQGPPTVQKEFGLNKHQAAQICHAFRMQGVNLTIYHGLVRNGKIFQRRKLSKDQLQRLADLTANASSPKVPPHKPPSSPG